MTPSPSSFLFTDRFGNKIEPTFQPVFPESDVSAETSAQILEVEKFHPEIASETGHSEGKGEDTDFPLAMQALLDREGRAEGRFRRAAIRETFHPEQAPPRLHQHVEEEHRDYHRLE